MKTGDEIPMEGLDDSGYKKLLDDAKNAPIPEPKTVPVPPQQFSGPTFNTPKEASDVLDMSKTLRDIYRVNAGKMSVGELTSIIKWSAIGLLAAAGLGFAIILKFF